MTNLYGNIVSNLACGLVGGPGLMSGRNIGPQVWSARSSYKAINNLIAYSRSTLSSSQAPATRANHSSERTLPTQWPCWTLLPTFSIISAFSITEVWFAMPLTKRSTLTRFTLPVRTVAQWNVRIDTDSLTCVLDLHGQATSIDVVQNIIRNIQQRTKATNWWVKAFFNGCVLLDREL